MDKIVDIPVKDPHGKLIGKARIEHDGEDNYHAHIVLDPQLGSEMMHAMAQGMVTGLSVGTEITPVMKKPDVVLVDAVSAYPDLKMGVFGKTLGERLNDAGLEMTTFKADGYFEIEQPPPPGQFGEKEIGNRFGFHKASIEGPNATAPIHGALRTEFENFANWLDSQLPGVREKEIAFDFLETASMWSHKAVARLSSGQEG